MKRTRHELATDTMSLSRLAQVVAARRIPFMEAGIMKRYGCTFEEARARAQASRRRGGRRRMQAMSVPGSGFAMRRPTGTREPA